MGGLSQAVDKIVKGKDKIFCVDFKYIPSEIRKDVTYGYIVVDYRLQNKDPNRTRLRVGGNIIEYPVGVRTNTTDTTTAKFL